ncbi:MAG: hypothetical protein K9M96_10545 [Deltaproteobacteria bacterium]|nr:hypothetical protein [Deltaproteobacteria bacterium]
MTFYETINNMACFLLHNVPMMKRIKILALALPLLLGLCQTAFSTDGVLSDDEAHLLELVNQARKDPLGMAASLGMNPETVLQDLPELQEILTGGLDPLAVDRKLYDAASAHTQDMIANIYYGHTSPDGRTCSQRIRESGYLAAACGEALGVVAFQNFMGPDEGVRIIFESVFRAELDPERAMERNILNPGITETGIAFGSGQFVSGGSTLNAYVATLDFGTPAADIETVEKVLVGMINKARNNPDAALRNAGIDPAHAALAYGDLKWALTASLTPLAWNDLLHGTASAHNRDMVDQRYYDTVSRSGLTPFERISSTGYDPARTGESLGIIWAESDVRQAHGAWEVARLLYEHILASDANPESRVGRNLFHPDITEVGIGVDTVLWPPGGDQPAMTYVAVVDFARPLAERSFVVGTVYEDRNTNGVMDQGEGLSGLKITLKPAGQTAEPEAVTRSGPAGQYQVDLSGLQPGFTDVYVEREGEVLGPFSFLPEGPGVNVFKNLRIDPRPETDGPAPYGGMKKSLTDRDRYAIKF